MNGKKVGFSGTQQVFQTFVTVEPYVESDLH